MSQRIAIDVGIVVTDMERSLSFYRDLLGLPVIAEETKIFLELLIYIDCKTRYFCIA